MQPEDAASELRAIANKTLPFYDDYEQIVLNNLPLIDVRAPVEYNAGAFINSVNLPLLNDEERHSVGIAYKKEGNLGAVALGHKLLSPYKKERVSAWQAFKRANPTALLYCFRGGQRSQIAQSWLDDAGVTIERIKGGYKRFRNYLMQQSELISQQSETLIIGGYTGTGKTLLIHKLQNAIDLEGLANHRGSAFGKQVSKQPAQIAFENALGYALIQHNHQAHKHLIIEHESHNVGRLFIPKPVYDNLMQGSLIILQAPLEIRTEIIFDEYVTQALLAYKNIDESEGENRWFSDANSALDKIQKRLGHERHRSIKRAFGTAFEQQQQRNDYSAHKAWITELLRDYYDPMYNYQLKKSTIPVIFKGDASEIEAYLKALEQ